MNELHSSRLILILVLILSSLLATEDIHAKDPCGVKQTQSGEVVSNEDMELQWAAGHPPNSISAGTSVPVAIDGGLGAYNWIVTSGDGYTWQNDETSQHTETPQLSNELKASADADCPVSISVTDAKNTVSGQLNIEGYQFSWDSENSDITFPTAETPIQVYVEGGKAPYTWEVTEGFELNCENDCGSSNTVMSNRTRCTGTITVTDACGSPVSGKIRRPGYWSHCGEKQDGPICYLYDSSPCKETKYIDLGDHRIKLTSCKKDPKSLTATCDDGFTYTAHVDQIGLISKCFNASYDSGIWWMHIYKWVCN